MTVGCSKLKCIRAEVIAIWDVSECASCRIDGDCSFAGKPTNITQRVARSRGRVYRTGMQRVFRHTELATGGDRWWLFAAAARGE